MYAPRHQLEIEPIDMDDDCAGDEHDGAFYLKEGWYEVCYHHLEYMYFKINAATVIGWQSVPPREIDDVKRA